VRRGEFNISVAVLLSIVLTFISIPGNVLGMQSGNSEEKNALSIVSGIKTEEYEKSGYFEKHEVKSDSVEKNSLSTLNISNPRVSSKFFGQQERFHLLGKVDDGKCDTLGKVNISNPKVLCKEYTWDCVWFGNYWQEDTNGDGYCFSEDTIVSKHEDGYFYDQNDRRLDYFSGDEGTYLADEKQPIKWRVLKVNGDDLFLLADKCLDVQPYNSKGIDITWEQSTIRSWLNGYGVSSNNSRIDYSGIGASFIDNAFTFAEKDAIKTSIVDNDNSTQGYYNSTYPWGGDWSALDDIGGNNTEDKIYFLSYVEATNPLYGFDVDQDRLHGETSVKAAMNTNYAHIARNAYSYNNKNGNWWLRSPSRSQSEVMYIEHEGYATDGGRLNNASLSDIAVRPALHVSLSNSFISSAGTVTSSIIEKTTWDCLWFGSYLQNDTNGDSKINSKDEKQPIKWRVLNVDDENVFLIADKGLDMNSFSTWNIQTKVSWENSIVRSWLNGYSSDSNVDDFDYSLLGESSFINSAFSNGEKEYIKNTDVNNDNLTQGYYNSVNEYYKMRVDYDPSCDTRGGNNTSDKIFLLSYAEITNKAYGFDTDGSLYGNESSRNCNPSLYCFKNVNYDSDWLLRSPGDSGNSVIAVRYDGYAQEINSCGMIRPALYVSIASPYLSFAGTVCSDGHVDEIAYVPYDDKDSGSSSDEKKNSSSSVGKESSSSNNKENSGSSSVKDSGSSSGNKDDSSSSSVKDDGTSSSDKVSGSLSSNFAEASDKIKQMSKEGYGSPADTIPVKGEGKNCSIVFSVSGNDVVTLVKGANVQISGENADAGSFVSIDKKIASVNKKGKLKAKKKGTAKISYTSHGERKIFTVNVIEPSISGGTNAKKLKTNFLTGNPVNAIVDIPLNSSVGIIKDTKNSITDLKTFINSDGKWAITGNAAVKGTVNIQFVADGKKINVKLVVKR